jgi:hypothetical protein
VIVVLLLLLSAAPAYAQHEHHHPAPGAGWAWSAESTVFLTGNFQVREFRDFHQVESQNWLMAMAARAIGPGALTLHGMLSLEPFTLRELGSAQAFQTGETFGGAPLIDYQHPHDLLMGLSARYERAVGPAMLSIGGGLVDAPALGPTAFMHRASARLHPTAPLSHHQLDSTHITHGVISGGARRGAWGLEASAFRGREPDEDRVALDLGALDSYSVRGSWSRNSTRAQLSVGWLADPHLSEPGDVTRLTASIEHERVFRGQPVALTVAWGQNRGNFSNENGFLVEAAVGVVPRGTAYLRGEIVDKHILEAGGAHLRGLQHPHLLSTVGALTTGYQHRVWLYPRAGQPSENTRGSLQSLSIGADVTIHRTPANLSVAYGHPVSIHLYGRWTVRYPERSVQEGR